ncbi:type VI secretion system baseplate subunit TssG [Burkholderia pseudomultivorans]|uniref:type VI secretion system baseplate subunit TssG n=1 Tax=Burkholderia pseudomultivorans TaxID=1207504 RepID=UPI0028750A06|nr:type VI secretion system baseplate subunit TssG [Burkholderia pseudomultivorans]MDS0794250.1 type VI secretion system baseplate subunit TssG [Burkholderia pseudomultivorans]
MAAQQGAGVIVKRADLPEVEPLVASLLVRAPHMSFMQLCRLLELRTPDAPGLGTCDTPEHEPVRFRPRPRLGFPAGEIASVEMPDDVPTAYPAPGSFPVARGRTAVLPPTVRTTFMGLYGVDAAMPSHTIDEIVLREEGHEVVEAFLDQFNHRFVTLLYRAWKKYRYPESFLSGARDAYSRNLLSLAGFGWGERPRRVGLPDSRLLAFLGVLIQKTRTPRGLARVVALTVPGVGVRVDEFRATTAINGRPQPLSATRPAGEARVRRGLGGGYVLGKRLSLRARAVCVTLWPANAQQAHDLLPGARLHRELMAFIQLYVGMKVDVQLRMEISSRLMPKPAIGQALADLSPRLGWTTILPSDAERTLTIPMGTHAASGNASTGGAA